MSLTMKGLVYRIGSSRRRCTVPSKPPTPDRLEAPGDLPDGFHGLVIVRGGCLVDRRVRASASLGNILHGMPELGQRFNIGSVLVHHPRVAARRLYHMDRLEELGDIPGISPMCPESSQERPAAVLRRYPS